MELGFTPIYKLQKGGLDITGHFQDRCISIRVDLVGGDGSGDTAQFVLDDRDWLIARPNVGDRVKLWLGYAEVGMSYMGEFELDEYVFGCGASQPKTISLKCSSTGQRSLLKSPITKTYNGMKLGEIFSDLAKNGGITAQVHPDIAGKTVESLIQTTSPQQLIAELERNYGAVAKVADGKLIVAPRDGGVSASGQTIPIVIFDPSHFDSLQVRHTERSAYSSVKAAYVDPKDYVTKFVEEKLPGASSDLSNLPFVPKRKFSTREQAEAAAKSQAQALQQSLGEVDMTLVKGDPWLRDQQRILIRGTRDGINGSYVTDTVSHTYLKDQGVKTAAKAMPDANGSDYEGLFARADTPEKLAALFIQPAPGGLVGAALALGGSRPTTADLINGVSPFR